MSETTDYNDIPCTCGVGAVFHAHLHTAPCRHSTEGSRPPSETNVTGEQAVLDAFAEYWRANYGDDCVISSREWHLPKLLGAIRRPLHLVLSGMQVQLNAARSLNNRYARAILSAAGTNLVAFDPMNPEGWMHAQTKYMLALIADRDRIAAELAAVREVEAWIQRGNDPLLPQHYVAGLVGERLGAFAGLDTADVIARSIPELGRALAAQETAQLFNCPTHFAGADPGCPACRAKQPPATEAHG